MEYGCTIAVSAMPQEQPQAINLKNADQWHQTFNSGRESLSGVKVNHKSVVGYPAFWRGVNLLANGVSGLPIDVFKREGNEDRVIAKQHPAQKLIRRLASPIQHARQFQKTMQGHALIFGNGFAWIERAGPMNTGKPVAMWVMDPQQMLVRYIDGELWYCTVIGGEQKKFPGRDVLHIAGLSHDGIVGYSALDTFNEAIGLGIAAQQFGSRFFGQGANMGGILAVPGHFDEEKIRNTMQAWSKMAEGMQKAHKVALLQDGAKFIPTSIDPNAGQFNETRDFEVRAVVANILGVPPHLLGDATRTSHNSLESENQSFLNHSLRPWLDTWEDELERKLLSEREQERGTHFIEFNSEAAVKMEFEKKINGIAKQVEIGMLTVNESRKLLNMPDVGEDGDKRYHPANWLEIGEEPEAMETPAPEPGEDDDTEETDTTEDTLRAILHSNVTNSLQFEQRKVTTAAKRETNFCDWLDGFYDQWAAESITGMQGADAIAAKSKHADESKRQLLNVAGSSMPATLSGNVADLVATWDDRAVTLTTDLMETVK